MSNKKYCYEKVAPTASAAYFSLRSLSLRRRDLVVAVQAFYHEIEEVIFDCHDHELMLIKFNWWRAEVAKLLTREADHPALKFLLECAPDDLAQLQTRFFAIIDGMEQAAISGSFATFEDVVVHYMRTAGERELLLQSLLKTTLATEKLFQAMLVIELVNYLQHLHRYVRRNLIYFAQDELDQLSVSPDMLAEYKTTSSIKKLLQQQAEKIQRAYEQATMELSDGQRAESAYLFVRCEMAMKILEAIREGDYQVLESFITLTPLRFWWIAWRNG